jgi:hypothetical protein
VFSGPDGAAAAAASSAPPEELEAALDDIAAARLGESEDDEVDEVAMLEAELDVYEAFAQVHCAQAPKGRAPPLCAELRERVAVMEQELAERVAAEGRENGTAHAEPRQRKPRLHGWTIFDGDPAVEGTVSLARDRFLTEVRAALGRAFLAPQILTKSLFADCGVAVELAAPLRGAGGVPGPRQVQVVGQHVSESESSLRLPPP